MFYDETKTVEDSIKETMRELTTERGTLDLVLRAEFASAEIARAQEHAVRFRIVKIELTLKAFVGAKEEGFGGYSLAELNARHPGWFERCCAGARVAESPTSTDVNADEVSRINNNMLGKEKDWLTAERQKRPKASSRGIAADCVRELHREIAEFERNGKRTKAFKARVDALRKRVPPPERLRN
jgi:hypothetical protein